MAPTLLGAHMRFTCDDCGYRFDVNYSGTRGGDDVEIPASVAPTARCSCASTAPTAASRCRRGSRRPPAENDATAPPVHYGDRILVLKYAVPPVTSRERWDVVVFKSPDRRTTTTPAAYTANYIKRLVGRPGESVMILDGDIYVAPAPTSRARRLEHDARKIQTKPRHVQDALWRIVYDNDFRPRGQHRGDSWRQPWQRARRRRLGRRRRQAARRASSRSTTRPAPAAGSASTPTSDTGRTSALHRLARVRRRSTQQRTDADAAPDLRRRYNVSDLKLSLLYHRTAGDGPLRCDADEARRHVHRRADARQGDR